jgi:hypothetical protein
VDLAYELHDLVRTLDNAAERLLRPAGLSYRRYLALVIIGEHPNLTGRNLGQALGVSEAAVSVTVRELMKAGLVHDVAQAGSGNVRRLSLSQSGRQKRAECSALLGASLDETAAQAGIDPHDLAGTIRLLHQAVKGEL